MNNENEIERMAKVLFLYQDNVCGSCGSAQACKDLGYGECGIFDSMAKDLINVGIGDKKQAVKEFAEMLKTIALKRQPNQYIDRYGMINVILPYVLSVEIDNLITELYGADE